MTSLRFVLLGLCAVLFIASDAIDGVTTPKPTTAKPTTKAATTGGCSDLHSSCSSWKPRGYCTDARTRAVMKQYCPLTCGYCGGVTTSNATTKAPTTGGCSDVRSSCEILELAGYCTNSTYRDYMRINCKLSCGYCSGVTTSKPRTVKPTTIVNGTTKAPTTGACSDLHSSCSSWKPRGYCTDARTKAVMKQYCPLTCGYCGGVTTSNATTKAPTTGGCSDVRSSCEILALAGYCTNYRDYMRINCKLSCGHCVSEVSK